MSSSSPRLSHSSYVPHDGTPVTQTVMRQRMIIDNFDNLISCTPEVFLKTYASKQSLHSDGLLAHVRKFLQKEGHLDTEGWIALRRSEKDKQKEGESESDGKGKEKEEKKNENETFAFLGKVADDICVAATSYDKTLQPQSDPKPSPTSSLLHSKAGYRCFPDWRALVLSESVHVDESPSRTRDASKSKPKKRIDTSDVAAIGEFKLKENEETIADDEEKILGAANQVMWNDPARERVLGFTIEKRRTRLWDFSRCSITACDPFDLDKSPDFLIRFILFILFAEKHEVGFDPTVHRIVVDNQTRYCYEVDNDLYLTVGPPLSEEAAYHMVGRASRVWTVVKLILDANGKIELKGHKYREDGVHRVLKDVWLYEEARSETAIQDQILGNLNDDQKMKLKRHFLTFLADLEVKFNGNVRRTLRCPDGQWKPVDWCNHHYSHKTDGLSSSQRGRDNPQPREAEPTRISRKHTPRKHNRSVAAEVCQSIYQLRVIKEAVICWRDMVDALNLFRMAKFVHRDVSGGNCLYFDKDGDPRGIIADLEYTKLYGDITLNDHKMGTPDFMAVEYQQNEFLFLAPAETAEEVESSGEWFAVNYLHDLESIYWQYLWFFHNRIPSENTASPEDLGAIQQQSKQYFGHNINGNQNRACVIQLPQRYAPIRRCLRKAHSENSLKPLQLSSSLRDEYIRVEKVPPTSVGEGAWRIEENSFTDEVYEEFRTLLQCASEHIPVVPIDDTSAEDDQADPSATTKKARLFKETSKTSNRNTSVSPIPDASVVAGPSSVSGRLQRKRRRGTVAAGELRRSRRKH